MMGGGCMGKNCSQIRVLSSSSMLIGNVRMLECRCPRICVVKKVNTLKNRERPLYDCHLLKVCLTMVM